MTIERSRPRLYPRSTTFHPGVFKGIVLSGALIRATIRANRESHADSFGNWVCRDVETSTGRVRGSLATVEVLLPIAAVALGMAAFAVVLHFAGRP